MSFYLVGGCYFFSLLAPVFGMRGGETMRRKKMSIIVAVFAMLFGLAQVAGASIPNRFVSTDGDSDVMNVNFDGEGLASGWYFGVYDYNGDPSSGLDLLLGSDGAIAQAEFKVYLHSDNNFYINVTTGVDESLSPVNIGTTDEFSFYFFDGTTYYAPSSITEFSGNSDGYLFSHSSGGNVIGTDLASVPLPSSAIFLFSGFVGLVAFGGRRKIMK